MPQLTPKERCIQALAQLMGDDLTRARRQAARMSPEQLAQPWGLYPSFTDYVRECENYEAEIRAAVDWVKSKED